MIGFSEKKGIERPGPRLAFDQPMARTYKLPLRLLALGLTCFCFSAGPVHADGFRLPRPMSGQPGLGPNKPIDIGPLEDADIQALSIDMSGSLYESIENPPSLANKLGLFRKTDNYWRSDFQADGNHGNQQQSIPAGKPFIPGSAFKFDTLPSPLRDRIHKLFENATSPSSNLRAKALKEFAKLDSKYLALTYKHLESTDSKIQKTARNLIISSSHKWNAPALIPFLSHKDRSVRDAAALAMVDIADLQSLGPVLEVCIRKPGEANLMVLEDLARLSTLDKLIPVVLPSASKSRNSLSRLLKKIVNGRSKDLCEWIDQAPAGGPRAVLCRILSLRYPKKSKEVFANLDKRELFGEEKIWLTLSKFHCKAPVDRKELLTLIEESRDWSIRASALEALDVEGIDKESWFMWVPVLLDRQRDFYPKIRIEANRKLRQLTGLEMAMLAGDSVSQMSQCVRDWQNWWADIHRDGGVDADRLASWSKKFRLSFTRSALQLVTPATSEVQRRGVWKGTYKGVSFWITDDNKNGRFDDYGRDGMVIGKKTNSGIFLSRITEIKGDWVIFQFDFKKKKFRVSPYSGPTGTMKITTKFAKHSKLEQVHFVSARHVSVKFTNELRAREVPIGIYRLVDGSISNGRAVATKNIMVGGSTGNPLDDIPDIPTDKPGPPQDPDKTKQNEALIKAKQAELLKLEADYADIMKKYNAMRAQLEVFATPEEKAQMDRGIIPDSLLRKAPDVTAGWWRHQSKAWQLNAQIERVKSELRALTDISDLDRLKQLQDLKKLAELERNQQILKDNASSISASGSTTGIVHIAPGNNNGIIIKTGKTSLIKLGQRLKLDVTIVLTTDQKKIQFSQPYLYGGWLGEMYADADPDTPEIEVLVEGRAASKSNQKYRQRGWEKIKAHKWKYQQAIQNRILSYSGKNKFVNATYLMPGTWTPCEIKLKDPKYVEYKVTMTGDNPLLRNLNHSRHSCIARRTT